MTKRVWYPLLEFLKLKKRRLYQTQHTATTLLLASGEKPDWVARLLGHSSTETLLKVYSRFITNVTRMDGMCPIQQEIFKGALQITLRV